MSEKRRQSIIFGGLISSAGVLLSKVLGLVYVIPFNMIAGDTNIQFYGYAYNIYSYVLSISIAGIPYAIATLVAKYYNVGDYKTTLLIKKISLGLMLALGFGGMCFVILASGSLANAILATHSSLRDIMITKNVMIIISFALFFVPMLSAYRGFYQGLKRMELYAFSQVLEQLVRVFFLLGAGAIAVYVFHQDQIWAVYFAVFSTSVAAICALIHIKNYDRREIKKIKELAKTQERVENRDVHVLLKELIVISIPYLASSIIAYSSDMVDLVFFSKTLESTGVIASLSNYIYGTIIAMHTKKVVAIPQILCVGFSASLIPYITTALENKDFKQVKKHIRDILECVIYIVLPLSCCLFFFSKEVMFLLYGNPTFGFEDALGNTVLTIQQLDYEDYLMKFRVIDSIFGTITPLFTSILIACRLRKEPLIALAMGTVTKLVGLFICVRLFGMAGSSISNLFSFIVIILIDLYYLNKAYHINWTYTLRKILFMLVSLLLTSVVYWIMYMVIGDLTVYGRMGMLPLLIFEGFVVLLVYLLLTAFFQIPQSLFNISFEKIFARLKR